jgi:hypothetical protein
MTAIRRATEIPGPNTLIDLAGGIGCASRSASSA